MQTDCFPDATLDWAKCPVSMLAAINPRYPVRKGQEYPFIEMAAVAEHFGGIQGLDTRKMEGSGLARFKAGDTLFAKITPCPENGKVAYVNYLPTELGLGSTEFIVLSPKEGCVPRFLFHLLCCYEVRGRAAARMEGSTGRQRVPDDVFRKRLLVPIPRPEEQAAIVHILDAVDTALERTREAVEKGQETKAAIIQQFFFQALGETAYADRPTKELPAGWAVVPTENLLDSEPKNGVSPKASSQPPGLPTFSIGAIRHGKIDLGNKEHLKYAQLPEKVAKVYKVNRGDVLIVRGNANPDLVGKAGMIDHFPDGCIYPDITKRVVFRQDDEHTVSPHFAVLAWNHPVVHNQVLRRAKTSNGTLKINNRDVKQIVMPVPPPQEQATLMNLAEALDRKIDALSSVANAYEQLKRSLMHDLLTGKVRVKDINLDRISYL
jgi:type I restriction enzyme S subunit